jgi:L-fuconolactonase
MRVDAHQHFWSLHRGDYDWLTPDLEPLYRDFGPKDLEPLLAEAGVERTIAVQAAPTLAETRFLLALASRSPFVAGVVGWVDLESADAVDRIEELAADPLLVGLRPMLQDLPDPDWILRPAVAPALERMAELELVFDALVRPVHLPRVARLVERHPRLRVVIDHGAKPETREARWESDMRRLADAGAHCKLSGLLTEVSADQVPGYAACLIEWFGSDRLLWGSDWPVLTLAASYREWWELTRDLLADLDADARAAILGHNAVRCYGLVTEAA